MAENRRIIYGTSVLVKESATTEEGIITKWRLDTEVNKRLGGISNENPVYESISVAAGAAIDLADNQRGDFWTSMAHPQMNWEDWNDGADNTGNLWEDTWDYWGGKASIGTGAIQLTSGQPAGDGIGTDEGAASDVAFFYIKNTGDTNNLRVSLDGDSWTYYLIVPPGGGLNIGSVGDTLDCNDIYLKAAGASTSVEWILANQTTSS